MRACTAALLDEDDNEDDPIHFPARPTAGSTRVLEAIGPVAHTHPVFIMIVKLD